MRREFAAHKAGVTWARRAARLGGLVAGLAAGLAGCQRAPSSDTGAGWAITAPQVYGGTAVAGIGPDVLDKAGLRVEWTVQLSLGRARELKQVFYRNGRVYAVDDRAVLHAVDGMNGLPLWQRPLGLPTAPVSSAQYYQDNLLFVVGNTFVQVRQSDGQIVKRLEPKFMISTAAARGERLIYLGGDNRWFYALDAAREVSMWETICPSVPTGSITVTTTNVYFVTQDNTLYVSRADQRHRVWEFQAAGSLVGVVLDKGMCLLPSADTKLYCFDPETGKMLWQYLAGGRLAELPVLTAGAIYQPVDRQSLLCLEREATSPGQDRRLRWELKNGRAFLAEDGATTYAVAWDGQLAVMDNAAGKAKVSFFVPRMSLYASNNEDALVVLSSRDGVLLALWPQGKVRAMPVVQAPAPEKPVAGQPGPTVQPGTGAPPGAGPGEGQAGPTEQVQPAAPGGLVPAAPTEPAPSAPSGAGAGGPNVQPPSRPSGTAPSGSGGF